MFDHQYSLYEPLLRIPLVVHYPAFFEPGRDDHPVSTLDLFPTLLELTGVTDPVSLSKATSLLASRDARPRLAEDPASSEIGIRIVQERNPDWDPTPWQRRLYALIAGDWKYIQGSNGLQELYDLANDPLETNELSASQADRAADMKLALASFRESLDACVPGEGPTAELSPEERERLKSLGYLE
jgi:arylsulfatase A-like enzyme